MESSGQNSVRKVGWLVAASLVFSNMVGSGIFTTSGYLLANLRSPWLLLAVWVLGGGLALAGTLSYAELGAALPHSGGDYVYLRKAYGPGWAFMSGWMAFFAGMGAPIALASFTFVEYLGRLFPALSIQNREPFFELWRLTLTTSPGHLTALGVVWLLTLVHFLGIRTGGKLQLTVTLVNITLILSYILFGFFSGAGSWTHFTGNPAAPSISVGFFPVIAVSLIWVMFSYSGFNGAAYVAGEIDRPGRSLPLALAVGTGTVTLLYLALNTVYVYARPVGELAGRMDVAGVAAAGLFGPAVADIFGVVISTCALAACSAMICLGPRIYEAMAADGSFFASAARRSRRFGTPAAALFIQALYVSLLIFIGSFEQLLTFCGFLLSLFSALTVSSLFVLRRRFPGLPRPFRVPGYPFTPGLFVAVSLWMMFYSFFSRPVESLIGAVIVAAGLPVYRLWKWKNRVG